MILTVVALIALSALAPSVSSATSSQPTRKLVLTPLPPDLPTSSSGRSVFPALIISLTDLQGNLLVSPNETTFYLSSSKASVLTVPATITIQPGQQFAVADVTTTATPGSSVVTAVAPGFESASVTFQSSVARGYPTGLSMILLPVSFPTGIASSANYAVEVVDAAGLPARTIQQTTVNLTSSDTSVLTVGSAVIPVNGSVGYFQVSTSGNGGTAEITASASGLVSDSKLITVAPPMGPPSNIQMSSPPVGLPADGKTYSVLSVSLADNSSDPVSYSAPVQVYLTSSRTDIATIPSVVTIPAGQSFVTVPVTTSSSSGSTIITATATNFISASATVTTEDIPPTQLGMYLSDGKALVSKFADTLEVVVQLQDSSGSPAEARTPANVIVSFSNSSLAQAPLTLTIPKGSDLVYASVPLSGATSGTFTAISNSLSTASAGFSASMLQQVATIRPAAPSVTLGQGTSLYFSLRAQGNPVPGATLTWSSPDGTFSNDSSTTGQDGTASVNFYPSASGIVRVVASANSQAYGAINASYYITVLSPTSTQKPSLFSRLLSFPYLEIVIAAAAAVALVSVLLVRRRRKKNEEAEGALSEEESGFTFHRPQLAPGFGPRGW